jgi:hypothetical protein
MDHFGTPDTMQAEQEAWDTYANTCMELWECVEFGCHAHSPQYTHCDKHRLC